MFRNDFKTTWRNLVRNKTFSFINLFGLCISLLVCLLISLFVKNELSYDDFQSNKDRIALFQQWENASGSGSGFADLFRRNISGVEQVTRVIKTEPLITNSNKAESFYEKNFCFAEANFPKVFDLHFLQGNETAAFQTPNFLVISRSEAVKYFGTTQAVGKLLFYNQSQPFYITGVYEDLPKNSHIAIDFICDYKKAEALIGQSLTGYWDGMSLTYLLLSKGNSAAAASRQLPQIAKSLHDPNAGIWKPRLISLKDIYLHEKMDGRIQANGAITNVYVFSAIALCIILLAVFNYVNMVTANAVSHMKSVTVRRLLGAQREQLIRQYLVESFVYVWLAALIAWMLAFAGVDVFNKIADTSLQNAALYSPDTLLVYFSFVTLFAVINGLYPAYFLSSFHPLQSIRLRFLNSNKNFTLRKALVVFQFTVSIIMIAVVIIVSSQLNYIHHQNLGYNRDEVFTLTLPSGASLSQKQTFLNNIGSLTGIRKTSLSGRLPGEGAFGNKLVESFVPAGRDITYQSFSADENFLPVFGIHLLQGRNFSQTDKAESNHFIINKSMSRLLNLENDAVGKPLAYYTYQYSAGEGYKEVPVRGDIIGVIDDYHQNNLHNAIQPLLLMYNAGWESEAAIKLNTPDVSRTVEAVGEQWKRSFPAIPFQYHFLDDVFNKTYQKEANTASALNIFSILAVAISCLGLLGLATITVQQKIKEIGIRKVLGASVTNIASLIAKSYVLLIGIALLIATPVAWYASDKWLQGFAYRATISWWMFAAAGGIALLTALITVSFQSVKAAIANPVKSLRTE